HLAVVDERGSLITLTAKDLGQRGNIGRQNLVEVIDAAGRWQHRGKERHVRRQRPRSLRTAVAEADRLLGEAIEGGGGGARMGVAAEMVGAEGVEGGEEDVGAGDGWRLWRGRSKVGANGPCSDETGGDEEDQNQ